MRRWRNTEVPRRGFGQASRAVRIAVMVMDSGRSYLPAVASGAADVDPTRPRRRRKPCRNPGPTPSGRGPAPSGAPPEARAGRSGRAGRLAVALSRWPIFFVTPATLLRWHRQLLAGTGPTRMPDPAGQHSPHRSATWWCGWPRRTQPGEHMHQKRKIGWGVGRLDIRADLSMPELKRYLVCKRLSCTKRSVRRRQWISSLARTLNVCPHGRSLHQANAPYSMLAALPFWRAGAP
jgi:hypothetical protein